MNHKLVQLNTRLKKHFQKNPDQEITLSDELHILLKNELQKTADLLRLVEAKRDKALLRILLPGELVSEQREEIPIPEKGISKEMIQAIKAYVDTELRGKEYEHPIPQKEAEKMYRNLKRFLKKGSEFPKRLEAFEKKPKGSVAIYEVLQDCTKNEFFKSMGAMNDKEVMENFSHVTMNLLQIDYLCELEKLKDGDECMILSVVDNKIIPLDIHTSYEHRFFRDNYSSRLEKGMKILLFNIG